MFQQSVRSVDDVFSVLARRTDGISPRLGLAISKKTVRLAVDRNRLKRHIRESFRHNKHRLAGLDIVVMSRNAAGSADTERLTGSLDAHWNRLIRLCEKSSSH